MSWWMRRIGTPVALAGYLLATFAASLHQHDHSHLHFDISAPDAAAEECTGHAGCPHVHTCTHHGEDHSGHSHESGAPAHHHHAPVPLHDDDCATCQFLALQYVSAPAVAVVALAETIQLPEPLALLRPEAPTLFRLPSRGPPASEIV